MTTAQLAWVQTDEDTAAYRSTRRSAKRPGDNLNVSMPESVFTGQVKRINPPEGREVTCCHQW